MSWQIFFDPQFRDEFSQLPQPVRRALAARATMLEKFGPALGRPAVDTLKGSRHANMKELRFDAVGGVWRVAFAFDRRRRCVFLAAGDKAGVNERQFYRRLIATADRRFDAY